jgi:hypothetical protein
MPGRAGGNDMTPEEKQKEKGIFLEQTCSGGNCANPARPHNRERLRTAVTLGIRQDDFGRGLVQVRRRSSFGFRKGREREGGLAGATALHGDGIPTLKKLDALLRGGLTNSLTKCLTNVRIAPLSSGFVRIPVWRWRRRMICN